LQNEQGEVLLQQRPDKGIWGGLWSFPEVTEVEHIETITQQQFHVKTQHVFAREVFTHVFTHFKLEISPYLVTCKSHAIADIDKANWYKIADCMELGLPAPVRTFLNTLI
jgi:A/G-specific adenine glycosylase